MIYLDPPFNSNVNYNIILKTKNREDSPSQIQAFEDTWKWGTESEMVYSQILGMGDRVADVIKGLRQAIGENDMMAYLVMMVIRLIELHRVLKDTGSLYLHCDPTANHYLKITLDSIFDPENFRNEIIWKRSTGHPLSIKKFESVTDTILVYCKSNDVYFSSVEQPLDVETIRRDYTNKDEHGYYQNIDLAGGKGGGKEAYEAFNGTLPPKGRAWAPPRREKLPDWVSEKLPDNYEKMNQLEKCHVLDKIGMIYWSKNKKPRFKRYLPKNPTKFATNLWDDISALSSQSKNGWDIQHKNQ